MSCNIATDIFTFRVAAEQKPFTQRGVLFTVRSINNPLGFLALVIILGMLLLRHLSAQAEDWDSPLPKHMEAEWDMRRNSLQDLQELRIP